MAEAPREQAVLPASVQARVPASVAELPAAPEREAAHSRRSLSFSERRYAVFPQAPPAQPEQEQVPQPEAVARPKPFFREQLWFHLKPA